MARDKEHQPVDPELKEFLSMEAQFFNIMSDSVDRDDLKAEAIKLLADYLAKKGWNQQDAVKKGFITEVKKWIDKKLKENLDLEKGKTKVDDDFLDERRKRREELKRRRREAKPSGVEYVDKGEAPLNSKLDYSIEDLNEETLNSLDPKIRAELDPYLEIHKLLKRSVGETDEKLINTIKELIEEEMAEVPESTAMKIVLKWSLKGLGGFSEENLREFIAGVLKGYEDLLNIDKKKDSENSDDDSVVELSLGDPENPSRNKYREQYLNNFGRLVEAGKDIEAYKYLIDTANGIISRFITSDDAQSSGVFGDEYLGMFDALKDFNLELRTGDKYRLSHKDWGSKEDSPERQKLANLLHRKSTEMICFSYIEEAAIRYSDTGSLVSNWKEIQAFDDKSKDNFGVSTFDFFLLEEEAKTKEKLNQGYKHKKLYTYLMWRLPGLIRKAEKELGDWNDRESGDHKDKLKGIIHEEIKSVLTDIKTKGIAKRTLEQHYFVVDKKKETRWDSDDREIVFTEEDLDGLGVQKEGDKPIYEAEEDHLVRYVMSTGVAVGVRQHLFTNDLARGSTPGGAMNTNKEWMIKTSRFALSNYKCYKGVSPHALVEGFTINWNAKGGKKNAIVASILLTESTLERVMRVRTERVNLGNIEGDDEHTPIELSYPDLYSFVVRAHDKRQNSSKASFEAFIEGLNAVDEFVSVALKVPGGISDKNKLKEMKPKELREAMLKDLWDLVWQKVSPMKANQDWVNWRHVAQYILMFVDRMYRVYKMCDDSPNGRAKLTHEIRQKFVEYSMNLEGVPPSNVGAWILDGGYTDKDGVRVVTPKSKLLGELKGSQETAAKGVPDMKEDPRFRSDVEATDTENKDKPKPRPLDIRDWILSRIPEVDEKTAISLAKERPLHARIVGQECGPDQDRLGSIARVKGPVGSAFEKKGIIALDNILHNHTDAFVNLWYDYINEGVIPDFNAQIYNVIFGTAVEDQKKVPEEEKK